MTQRLFSKAGLLTLALVTFLVTIAIQQLFKGVRWDLTEDQLFTLSQGTRNLLVDLESHATLQLFYSDSQTGDLPFIRNYARRVMELLDEYVLASKGKLTLTVIDPEPFSANEDKAAEYGLQAIPLGSGAKREAYFGLVITQNDNPDKREVISFLHPDKERFLEYDISKLVYAVTQTSKPKVGLLSGLPVQGGFDMASRQPNDPWVSIAQLEQLYDITHLRDSAETFVLADDLKLLIIIHPKSLSDQTRYAIDQFVLGGGNALVFVDPQAESARQGSSMGMGNEDISSSLEPLFKAWGIKVEAGKVVADAAHALSVGTPSGRPVRHLGILGYGESNINKDDVVTASLRSVNLATAGAIETLEGAETSVEALLQSSKNAMLMDASRFAMLFDPSSLFNDFQPTGETYTLAARITGHVYTAYPEGRIEQAAKAETDSKAGKKDTQTAGTQPTKTPADATDKPKQPPVAANANSKQSTAANNDAAPKPVHRSESVKPINVIVVADTDVLTNRLWVQTTRFFGQKITQPFANNGDMLINMVDNLLGNADLISIRGHGQFARPFEKVNALERAAEASFYQKEEQLKKQLADTEAKLRELQRKKQGEEKQVLSPEQEQEIEKFVQEKLQIRKQLRNVQHQLSKDIDQLEAYLKGINILAMPLLITLLVLGYRCYRRRQKPSYTLAYLAG